MWVLAKFKVVGPVHRVKWDSQVRRGDIRKLDFDSNSVEAIYSSHALEHLYLSEVRTVLCESLRVLKSGGIIRLALPDAALEARKFIEGVDAGDVHAAVRYNERLLAFPDRRPTKVELLRSIFAGHVHRWQPTALQVSELLAHAGFESVLAQDFRNGALPGLSQIETRPESFFLEARKP
jgi:SAM-dependent methyltransferase